MAVKRVVPREAAVRDVEDAIAFYLAEAAPSAALGFIDALEAAYRRLAAHPSIGSPRYGHALTLPGLRFWPLQHYPFLIFYLERFDHIDVWRVLHAQRDIPTSMHAPEEE